MILAVNLLEAAGLFVGGAAMAGALTLAIFMVWSLHTFDSPLPDYYTKRFGMMRFFEALFKRRE